MTLELTMPLAPYRIDTEIATLSPEAPLILVADDHADSRYIARIVLENAGFRVVEARTGREALVIAQVERPDAIMLDIVMPELTGWEVARAIRADHTTPRPAIIAVTALSGLADHEMSLAAGCDEMLVKPVHPRSLVRVVRRYVQARAVDRSAG
ncbi:MAG TPA: response regulator [Gemmatimonadaceae bacterium]|nr:response regulator [Gemmatimonadaceae bacterium]